MLTRQMTRPCAYAQKTKWRLFFNTKKCYFFISKHEEERLYQFVSWRIRRAQSQSRTEVKLKIVWWRLLLCKIFFCLLSQLMENTNGCNQQNNLSLVSIKLINLFNSYIGLQSKWITYVCEMELIFIEIRFTIFNSFLFFIERLIDSYLIVYQPLPGYLCQQN